MIDRFLYWGNHLEAKSGKIKGSCQPPLDRSNRLSPFSTYMTPANRVWKGILGIRDLTKIRCGIRENAKYLDGIRDLTATREAGFAKIWARDAGFFGLSVGNSGNRHDPSKRSSGKSESTRRAQNINQKGQSTS